MLMYLVINMCSRHCECLRWIESSSLHRFALVLHPTTRLSRIQFHKLQFYLNITLFFAKILCTEVCSLDFLCPLEMSMSCLGFYITLCKMPKSNDSTFIVFWSSKNQFYWIWVISKIIFAPFYPLQIRSTKVNFEIFSTYLFTNIYFVTLKVIPLEYNTHVSTLFLILEALLKCVFRNGHQLFLQFWLDLIKCGKTISLPQSTFHCLGALYSIFNAKFNTYSFESQQSKRTQQRD